MGSIDDINDESTAAWNAARDQEVLTGKYFGHLED